VHPWKKELWALPTPISGQHNILVHEKDKDGEQVKTVVVKYLLTSFYGCGNTNHSADFEVCSCTSTTPHMKESATHSFLLALFLHHLSQGNGHI